MNYIIKTSEQNEAKLIGVGRRSDEKIFGKSKAESKEKLYEFEIYLHKLVDSVDTKINTSLKEAYKLIIEYPGEFEGDIDSETLYFGDEKNALKYMLAKSSGFLTIQGTDNGNIELKSFNVFYTRGKYSSVMNICYNTLDETEHNNIKAYNYSLTYTLSKVKVKEVIEFSDRVLAGTVTEMTDES